MTRRGLFGLIAGAFASRFVPKLKQSDVLRDEQTGVSIRFVRAFDPNPPQGESIYWLGSDRCIWRYNGYIPTRLDSGAAPTQVD